MSRTTGTGCSHSGWTWRLQVLLDYNFSPETCCWSQWCWAREVIITLPSTPQYHQLEVLLLPRHTQWCWITHFRSIFCPFSLYVKYPFWRFIYSSWIHSFLLHLVLSDCIEVKILPNNTKVSSFDITDNVVKAGPLQCQAVSGAGSQECAAIALTDLSENPGYKWRVSNSASKSSIRRFVITEEAPTPPY